MRSRRRNAPSVPASLQRSASASNRRFSLPENWRRLAMATTSGSRRAASSEAISKVAIRATSETASRDDPFVEDFSNEVMFGSYLYSKLPETGVPPHIGTGGGESWAIRPRDVAPRGTLQGFHPCGIERIWQRHGEQRATNSRTRHAVRHDQQDARSVPP